jgi:DNA-binding beta-propeller fold protein YncE
MMADDSVTARLNGTVIGTTTPPTAPTTFTAAAPSLQHLLNTLLFEVHDTTDSYTALNHKATITWDDCTGYVKVCKVAGAAVAQGTPFTFTAADQTVTVLAGPAPGGYCMAFPHPIAYGPVVVHEASQPEYLVMSPIAVLPASPFGGYPAAASVTVQVGSGVTEAVFTNVGLGWMEVCKETTPVVTAQMFSFTITPPAGPVQTVVIPGGSTCSAPLHVAAGTVTVTEPVTTGWNMLHNCHTIPVAAWLLTCDEAAHKATVKVTGGDESTQTVLYIHNCKVPCLVGHTPDKLDMDATATKVATLPRGAVVVDSAPDPAGKVIYVTTAGRHPGIFSVPAIGGAPRRVLAGGMLRRPTGIAVSSDGRTLFVADRGANAILAVPAGGATPTVLRGSAGSAPRGLEVQTRDDVDTVVYTGRNAANGRRALLALAAAGADRPVVLAQGAQLRDPDGVAVATTGAIYVADHAGRGGRVLRVKGGRITTIADHVRVGDVGGIALRLDESEIVVSSRTRLGGARLRTIDLGSGRMRSFEGKIGGNRWAGGLHRALNGVRMAWAGSPQTGSGRVYRFVPAGTARKGRATRTGG